MKKNKPQNGAFWMIDGELYAFPFEERKYPEGLAKSKSTYAHKNLWRVVCPQGCNKPYNYYPRGRVHIGKAGEAHIYLNPNISDKYLADIKEKFGIFGEVTLHYEYTEHYKCYLDEGWRAEKSV